MFREDDDDDDKEQEPEIITSSRFDMMGLPRRNYKSLMVERDSIYKKQKVTIGILAALLVIVSCICIGLIWMQKKYYHTQMVYVLTEFFKLYKSFRELRKSSISDIYIS